MPNSALSELQQQIEAVRQEAFAAGYTAAMASIRELACRPAPDAKATVTLSRGQSDASTAKRPAPATRRRRTARSMPSSRVPARRLRPGANAQLVEEILSDNVPRALRAGEIRSALQQEKGVVISFTSIGNALRQLEARQSAEQIHRKSWRYRTHDAA